MATLRDLKKRLRAVKNTQKITKAMKMVAASKLRRAQNAILQARPYALRMNEVVHHIVNTTDVSAHPLMAIRVPRRVELVVMTSNRGLCGSFNSNMIRTAEVFLRENKARYDKITVSTIGRKGTDHFRRRGLDLASSWDELWDNLKFERAAEVSVNLATRYARGELDAVYLCYNEFKSAISQKAVVQQLLPVKPLDGWEETANVRIGELASISGDAAAVAGHTSDIAVQETESDWQPSAALETETEGYEHLYEPSRPEVLDVLLPQHIAAQIWRALLESMAAEHGARMSAMDAASRNAKDLIEKITLQANRVRQAGITTELMEIVSGAEALKG